MANRRDTRLAQFIQKRGLSVSEIYSVIPMHRSQFSRYLYGLAQAREGIIVRIVRAIRRVTAEPIKANQLFYLGDDDEPA